MFNQFSRKAIFATTLVVASAALAAGAAFSWVNVNSVMAEITAEVTADIPEIQNLKISFNPLLSDLSKDTIALELSASSDSAAWTPSDINAAVGFSLQAEPPVQSQNGEQQTVVGALSGSLQAATIPALNYLFADRAQYCAQNEKAGKHANIQAKATCDLLSGLLKAAKISEFKPLLVSTIANLKVDLMTEIDQKTALLDKETDEEVKDGLRRDIRIATRDLEVLKNLKISGGADEVVVDIDWMIDFGLKIETSSKFVIKDNVTILAVFLRTNVDAQLLAQNKEQVVNFLQALDRKDASAMDLIRNLAFGYGQFVKELFLK